MTLGERIREQRKARGMSQEMVAGHLGGEPPGGGQMGERSFT